jgi:hypothetical protein
MAATQYFGTAKWGTTQTVAYTGTAGVTTNGASVGVYKLRIVCTSQAFVVVGKGVTATVATGAYMPADTPEYVTCFPGEVVSAIQFVAGGSMYVTECV